MDSIYEGLPDAREDLMRGSYAYITYNLAAYFALRNDFSLSERCIIGEVVLPTEKPKLGTMLPKKSPHKRLIDYQ